MNRPLFESCSLQNSAVISMSAKIATVRKKPCGQVCFESPVGAIGCAAGVAESVPSTTVQLTPPMVVQPLRLFPSNNDTQPAAASDGVTALSGAPPWPRAEATAAQTTAAQTRYFCIVLILRF